MSMESVLIAVGVVALIGLILGGLIGFAAKKFAVASDPRIEEVTELLPGANCGGCGYAGCADLAKAVVTKGVNPSLCAVCAAENVAKICAVMGMEAETKEKKVAVVYCSGDHGHAKMIAQYNGLNDCRAAASLHGGGKGCRFGCIGLGSCARSCPFGAIEIRRGLAIVHPEICVGCGKCVEICPRKLIRLVPAASKGHIYCNSLLKGPQKKKFCSIPCIACRKCVKAAPEVFNPQGFLVRATKPELVDEALVKSAGCPTGALQTAEEHLALGQTQKNDKEGAA